MVAGQNFALTGDITACTTWYGGNNLNKYRNELLIFVGVIASFLILGLILYSTITTMVRETTQNALTPVAESNNTLQTRIAEVLNPTPTILPDPVTVIHEIRSLARLETIQYSLEKVITAEQGQGELGFLFGDRLLFVGHGKVIAGIDLALMRPEDMWVEGQVLHVRLPAAQVFVATLDNEKSYVYNRDTGLLNKGDVNLETNARAAAEKEILKAAVEDGILVQAQQNGEGYLSRLLRGLGYADVIFENDITPEPLPTSSP